MTDLKGYLKVIKTAASVIAICFSIALWTTGASHLKGLTSQFLKMGLDPQNLTSCYNIPLLLPLVNKVENIDSRQVQVMLATYSTHTRLTALIPGLPG